MCKYDARIRPAALLELLQAAAEQEQLLEHHAAARLPNLVRGLRPVDGGKCVRRVQQAVLRAQHLGQRVGPVAWYSGKRSIGYALHVALG